MAIGEICSREVVYVGRLESAAEAARLMRAHHVGSLVVLDPPHVGGRPVGVVTDRDVAVGVVALGLDAERTPVEGIMRAGVATIGEDEGVGRAIALMKSEGVRRLPVTNDKGELVGIIAADDLLELFGEEVSAMAGMIGRALHREREERVLEPAA